MVLDSEVYSNQYEEFIFINDDNEEGNSTWNSNVPVFSTHSIEDVPDDQHHSKKYKQIYLPEIASQFRTNEILLSLEFDPGFFGVNHDGGGFSTDISDTCHWLTPFVLEPEDPYDLW